MKVSILVEDNALNNNFSCEHGFSALIETTKHKILFDCGFSNLFLDNAKKLNKTIDDVNFFVLSHGHNDHGGGIEYFLQENKTAPLYCHKNAFDDYCSIGSGALEYAGLDKGLKACSRIVFVDSNTWLDENILLLSSVTTQFSPPPSNATLLKRKGDSLKQDDFAHEIYLSILENDKLYLFSGCSHRGIQNIVESVKQKYLRYPDVIIGGLHLLSPSSGESADDDYIDSVAKYLDEIGATVYAGHCTGERAVKALQALLKSKFKPLHAGSVFEFS